ncbi:MAG: hypothetical protein HW403_71 [Dehalococcoidia bacterium]|nr:hypothetical protein [Dehalococcoidia bacterium]
MSIKNHQLMQQSEELYDKYGKPLESDHQGEYLAISPEGKTLLGQDLLEVMKEATDTFGPGNFIFKVGDKAVGKWR